MESKSFIQFRSFCIKISCVLRKRLLFFVAITVLMIKMNQIIYVKKRKKKNEIDFFNSSILPPHNKHLYVSIEDGESVKAEKDSVLKKLY